MTTRKTSGWWWAWPCPTLGYDVLTAENGRTGLKLFLEQRPPIVITDIKMPDIDGVDLLGKIKAVDPDAEVIMITGHGDMEVAIQSFKHDDRRLHYQADQRNGSGGGPGTRQGTHLRPQHSPGIYQLARRTSPAAQRSRPSVCHHPAMTVRPRKRSG